MTTTRWKDEKTRNIDEAINLIMHYEEKEKVSTNMIYDNWHFDKAFNENKKIILNGKEIEYNYINCEYDQITEDVILREDNTVHKKMFIIPYYNGSYVSYIIQQNSGAQKLLRKMLSYNGKNEIIKSMHDLSSDFFVWFISKVYSMDNIIETDNDSLSDLRLESIKGFRGNTDDLQTQVSAEGESVMNIISTLSFLLESRQLNKIILEVSYGEHENIQLILKKDNLSVDIKSYQGLYENIEEKEMVAKLYLLVYLEILVILDQEYYSDKENDAWGKDSYIEFMSNVADKLREKVDDKLKNFES